jgi:hypothetical protein
MNQGRPSVFLVFAYLNMHRFFSLSSVHAIVGAGGVFQVVKFFFQCLEGVVFVYRESQWNEGVDFLD